MEEKTKQISLEAGAFAKMAEEADKKITFDINKPVQVTFETELPEEINGENGVFYKFVVNGDKYFTTGAITMLHPLARLKPLKGKKVSITKKIDNGKQTYSVIEL